MLTQVLIGFGVVLCVIVLYVVCWYLLLPFPGLTRRQQGESRELGRVKRIQQNCPIVIQIDIEVGVNGSTTIQTIYARRWQLLPDCKNYVEFVTYSRHHRLTGENDIDWLISWKLKEGATVPVPERFYVPATLNFPLKQ